MHPVYTCTRIHTERHVARIVSLGQLQCLGRGADIFRVLLYCYSLSDVVEKTWTRRRSRIPCVFVEKNTTRRRESVGFVVEKNQESRRTFNENSCDLLTAITHTKILCALYKTNKQFNKKTIIMKAKRSMSR